MTKISIYILYTINTIIIFLGFFFTLYSIITHNTMIIIGRQFPAFIMGLPVMYFSIIYFVKIKRLSKEIASKQFSISNFNIGKRLRVK